MSGTEQGMRDREIEGLRKFRHDQQELHEMNEAVRQTNRILRGKIGELVAALSECVTQPGSCAMSHHSVGDSIRRLEAINEIARAAIEKVSHMSTTS